MDEPGPAIPIAVPGGPAPGHVLVDRYELRHQLRIGPLGARWHAHDRQLDRPVTLKLVFTHALTDPIAREWFRRESLATARVEHPNVTALYDAYATDENVFVVLEHVEGVSLERLGHPRLDPQVVAALGCQAADGLAAAHEVGVVHRDVRPANLLVAASGHVKVTNFWLSKLHGVVADHVTIEPALRDIFGYVAPEHLAGEPVGAPADVYALGLTLWEALAGHLPFSPEPLPNAALRRLHAPLPPPVVDAESAAAATPLVEAIEHATRAGPIERPTAAELADALRVICGPRPHASTARLLNLPEGASA
jgi:serine/threonine protein kinase